MLFHSRWLLNGRVWLLKWTILSSMSLGFSCQLESQDFGDCTGIFFYYFRRECCVTSAMLLCLERCICLVSHWQGCYGKGTDRLSPHYQPVARERLSSAHTQTSACEQCSRQWCRSLQEWGLMVFAVRVSLIWLFNPSILHALLQEGCERGKTVSRPAASTLVKWFLDFFLHHYFHCKNC